MIYSRISDDPRGLAAGVERQTDECRALADGRGIDILEVIEDNDLSASTGKRRPGFERVLGLIESRTIDTVIVWHTDRLYRLPRDLEPLIDLAETRTLRFVTVTSSNIDLNTSSGRMMARMLAAASANEVEHKAERQRSASDQRAAKGAPTARPGYGFRRDGDRVALDPDEAEVLREATRRVLAGESLRSVAADFNARGISSPSAVQVDRQVAASKPQKMTAKEWNGQGLRRALERPSMAGLRVHRGEIIGEARGDAVIERGEWDRLMALFNDPMRAPGRTGRGPLHLLSGIAVCGACGAPMYRQVGWEPKPGSKTRYGVAPAYGCKACSRVRRAQEPVDEFVTEVILNRLERPDAAALFEQGDAEAWDTARTSIDEVDARLSNAADSFAEGDIDRQQLARITANLRTKREALELELRRAMPPAVPVGAVGPLARGTWAALDIEQRRTLVRALVDVTVLRSVPGRRGFDPTTVTIEWRSSTT